MSAENSSKDKPPPAAAGLPRPAPIQHAPAAWPALPEYPQWHMWPWPMTAASFNPYQHMVYLQQQHAVNPQGSSAAISAASPRGKDDSVKVVKPKDTLARGIHSPAAGIQSPKPNSPGFHLSTIKGGPFTAFSPYQANSRTDATGASVPTDLTTGVDLTKSSSGKKSKKPKSSLATTSTPAALSSAPTSVITTPAEDKDKKDDPHKPVGVVKARHRAPADGADSATTDSGQSGAPPSTSAMATSSVVTTSTTVLASAPQQPAAVNTTVSGTWPAHGFHPAMHAGPYMAANPYQPFAMSSAAGPMYMMPTHRPMFPAQPGVPYLPLAPQQIMTMPELTVKTSQQQQITAHNASTSPNKPMSAASSPKSPLDKFREKMNEISQKSAREASRQTSPSNSESKSVSSEATDKLHEAGDKSNQTSVIMQNTQSTQPFKLLKEIPKKAAKRDKANKSNNNTNSLEIEPKSINTADKGPKAKVRKTISNSSVSSVDDSHHTKPLTPIAPKPVTSPTKPPLIAPAKFKPDPIHTSPTAAKPPQITSPFAKPATSQTKKRSSSQDKQSRGKRSNSKDSLERPKRSASKDSLDTPASRRSSRERTTSTSSSTTLSDIIPAPVKECESPALTKQKKNPPEKLAKEQESTEIIKDVKLPNKAVAPKQSKNRKGTKRKSTDTNTPLKVDAPLAPAAPPVIPTDVENKQYLWAEDAFDPVIVKHNKEAYDICQDDDLKQLEAKLKSRLKTLNKQIQSHQNFLNDENAFLTLSKSLSNNSESQTSLKSPTSPDKAKSLFSVRSDSHPSLKMKAAAKAKSRASQSEDKDTDTDTPPKPVKQTPTKTKKSMAPLTPIAIPEQSLDCRKLTKEELLSVDGLILTCIEGLFYESRIKPIEPPDIYGVVIDGERHSKPRIFTEEELLSNTFANLTPQHLSQLAIDSRVCAYWSDMIGCLYPGKVTALYPAKNSNAKHLIDIEFDDGDSGKFPLYQIRFLPHDYPHVDYDVSNMIPVGRRRRSTVPETPPIMTTPPSDRSRLSQGSVSRDISQAKKRGRPAKASLEPEVEAFDQSTDEERVDNDESESGPQWQWFGPATKKQARGRGLKVFYSSISNDDNEILKIGDCAVFKSVDDTFLPYIGQILNMWESWGAKMVVSVKWFYHPEELKEVEIKLPKFKGALFHSDHADEIDIQTIIRKCEVISYEDFKKRRLHIKSGDDRLKYSAFYLAGNYDAARCKVNCLYV